MGVLYYYDHELCNREFVLDTIDLVTIHTGQEWLNSAGRLLHGSDTSYGRRIIEGVSASHGGRGESVITGVSASRFDFDIQGNDASI